MSILSTPPSPAELSAGPVLELAVFTVRQPDAFVAIQARTHESLGALPGFRAALRLRGVKAALFADVVAWQSLDAAQRAASAVRDDPRVAPRFAELMANIDELRLFAHYQVDADVDALLSELRRAPLLEVAAYAVRDAAAHREVHAALHRALAAQPGHRGGAAARQLEDATQFADLVAWQDAEAHHHAGAALQQNARLAPLFAGIAELKVFELFTAVG